MPNIKLPFKPLCSFSLLVVAASGLAWAEDAKSVSQAEALRAVVTRVQPIYPSTARQLKIEGAVELSVTIADSGVVEKVDIVSGNPMLTRPAADALKRWKFNPFTQDGKAVKAVAPVTVSFKL
ncbi:MAG TPA: energy transducer TonB [Bryobacteraceae bacterium]|nr:energy transducer TonB [Bryobacteraceae bacterium]